ncbi:aldose epimerase family protein [Novosphingobium sp. MMS21-SN21R]|uniref:aldose epimerase family protein n=1 Tax=Novosphingobium sp. MMS21-SN21R TaxID=2969298 RepID=UPI0028871526|nr:aldose epimerase family protein [Novosphingobium sp. MMS21-SN21R]MDT0508503.1 aldose epimerase family protein [Novosphingobium sp. MMS21-SN21R]
MRSSKLCASALAGALVAGSPALAATAERSNAGLLADGTTIEAVTLTNAGGISARILTYGATLQSLFAPDATGKIADIVLGQDTPADYERHPNYYGVTVGRYANRIAGGHFTLDGVGYQLPLNNGANSLHGGTAGFDKRVWLVRSISSGPVASVVLSLHSPDGDQGYPGAVDATVTYSLDEGGSLTIVFGAATTKPTIINMTNHALFNLAGDGSVDGAMAQKLTIPAAAYTPVDATLIPTGELRPVSGTAFDFRNGRVLAEALRNGHDEQIRIGRGYDHNFALDKGLTATPQLAARLEDPASGRMLEVLTTEPGLQLYTGNFLDGTSLGKNGHLYRMGDGIALEPQKFPDAPNQPGFVSARVDPGKPYRHVMVLRLTTTR